MTPNPHNSGDRRLTVDRAMLDDRTSSLKRELDSVLLFMDERFRAQEKAVDAALVSQEKAVLKAENLATARSEAQNEWRATMTELIASTLQRPEYMAGHQALAEKVDLVNGRLDRIEGNRSGMTAVVPWIFAGAGVLVAIVSLVIGYVAR